MRSKFTKTTPHPKKIKHGCARPMRRSSVGISVPLFVKSWEYGLIGYNLHLVVYPSIIPCHTACNRGHYFKPQVQYLFHTRVILSFLREPLKERWRLYETNVCEANTECTTHCYCDNIVQQTNPYCNHLAQSAKQ